MRDTEGRNAPQVQLAADYSVEHDVNVLSTQRVNRAVLPGMRERGAGLVVWVSKLQRQRRHPAVPRSVPRRQGRNGLARGELRGGLARWGVETSIVVPGSFTSGTNHFAHSGRPADTAVEAAYETRYAGLMDQVAGKLAVPRSG
ncbi:MAG: hypothetical protein ACRDRN_04840 [Sciscionella sp.]